MKTTMVPILLVVSLGVACRNPIRMGYDEASGRVLPLLNRGDVIAWNVSVNFFGALPCEPNRFKKSEGRECEIASTAKSSRYGYDCGQINCDPEIVVDEDKPILIERSKGARPGGPDTKAIEPPPSSPISQPIYIYCIAQETVVRPPNLTTASAGEMIGWLNVEPVLDDWTVTLQGDYKGDFCGGKYTFKDGDNKCKLQKSANAAYVDYTVTSKACKSVTGRITPQ
jgi:hypothetical protein